MKRRQFLAHTSALAVGASSVAMFSHASAQNKDDAVVVGCTAALSGPLGSLGMGMKAGVDAAFSQINAQGGVNGRTVRFDVLDDAYVPARSVENVRKLLGDSNVIALMGCLGTPSNAAITPVVEEAGITHLAPLTGAASLRRSDFRHLFHVRASYTDEIQRLVGSLVSMGIKDLAVVHLDNPYGREVLEDAVKAMTQVGIKAVATMALATDGANMESVLAAIKQAKPSAVLLGTAGAATTALVAGLRKQSTMLPIAGVSASLTQDGIRQLGGLVQGVGLTTVFPDPWQAKHKLVRDYQAAMTAMGARTFDSGSLEGYVNARIMVEALTRAGKGAGREKVRQGVASIRNLDLGGFSVDYSPAAGRVGSKYVGLGILGADGRLKV